MTLREQIESAIASKGGDAGKAAIEVCKVLEDEIGLGGSGWWDNDPELHALLQARAVRLPHLSSQALRRQQRIVRVEAGVSLIEVTFPGAPGTATRCYTVKSKQTPENLVFASLIDAEKYFRAEIEHCLKASI